MGIFGKIFGGGSEKQNEPGDVTPPASPAPAAKPAEGVPARRERSKPKTATDVSADASGENAALIAAIHAVVQGDSPETRKALYEALLAAEVYLVVMGGEVPDPTKSETGEVNLQEGQQVSLATIRDPNGAVYLPAFTDVDRMSNTLPEDAKYLRVPAPAAFRMFLQGQGNGIVINPGQAPSGVITRGEAELLAQGVVPEIGENGQLVGAPARQMRIGIGKLQTPAPESFVEAIRAAAAGIPAVREVHLFVAGLEDQPPRQMIGVAIDDSVPPDQMHPLFDAIGKAAFAARVEGQDAFDMMPLAAELLDAIKPLDAAVYVRA